MLRATRTPPLFGGFEHRAIVRILLRIVLLKVILGVTVTLKLRQAELLQTVILNRLFNVSLNGLLGIGVMRRRRRIVLCQIMVLDRLSSMFGNTLGIGVMRRRRLFRRECASTAQVAHQFGEARLEVVGRIGRRWGGRVRIATPELR